MSIVDESPGYMQVLSDGSVKRFAPEAATASTESFNGYKSRDVVIDSSKPTTARIFLPDVSESVAGQLPVLVYFHGGGFCIGSTTWLGYHHFLGDLSAVSKSIVLSVDYRLAPENKLPIAYDDCYSSLEWLSNNASSEPWLEKADLLRVFLSGDSAGGNIVHQVAVKVIKDKVSRVRIKGLIPIHPYFGSEKRTELEMAEESAGHVQSNDMFWRLSLPVGENRDYLGCNFEKTELSGSEWDQFPRVLVFVAGLDFLKERGVMYADFLQKKGVQKVSLIEAEGESHVYHVFHPKSEAATFLQKQMSDFMHSF
ncbi:probable carboxylesterase 17 [Coffea eugenioides]|uniref:probable carboxylesterase 17 n=1 Tax=Coffea eugenioides TaxID=49369 RepID=UPI000F60CFBC|nr:probable carboxylesterase 17 [Coffea eugenioides]